jgi:hypothetical protein
MMTAHVMQWCEYLYARTDEDHRAIQKAAQAPDGTPECGS